MLPSSRRREWRTLQHQQQLILTTRNSLWGTYTAAAATTANASFIKETCVVHCSINSNWFFTKRSAWWGTYTAAAATTANTYLFKKSEWRTLQQQQQLILNTLSVFWGTYTAAAITANALHQGEVSDVHSSNNSNLFLLNREVSDSRCSCSNSNQEVSGVH